MVGSTCELWFDMNALVQWDWETALPLGAEVGDTPKCLTLISGRTRKECELLVRFSSLGVGEGGPQFPADPEAREAEH